jgi:pimeloyl-ACP methyl ester carboxylesterase
MYLEDRSMPSFGFNLGMYSALPMETVLKALMHRISQVRRSAPWIRRFDLVGHSMGGVLSAQAIKRGALDGLKTRFVGLGAPFRGTYAALVSLLIPGAFDLLPIHSRYRDLIGQTWLEQTLFLSIAGGFDVLAPPDRCHHPLAKNIVFHDVDHAGLLVREDVFAAVYDFLARPI